ncbi:MAG: DUF3783 domain-containing protein [Proteobacteria bacterium]|nr:DUF3783 domain-containing protein [Pseudomonadota bacterium]MBU4468938.1 DUF3783 domain-containing protein [Pseudomonadota bacterium]MCG2751174.1 DUF3783 domain-containing protein [Desulfobacteraceae bacterium]
MMKNGTFQKVEKSEKILFGPRAALVCGFEPEAREIITGFFKVIEVKDLPLVFPANTDGETSLLDLLSRPDQSGRGLSSGLDCAIILAGITENELHRILSAFRGLGLPRPFWATLTPISQTWTLSALIAELKKERAAMEKRKQD